MSLRLLSRRSPVGFIEPCQPIGAAKPPSGRGWLHEIKLDGFRLMAQRRCVDSRLLTRNGNDWTDRYPSVLAAVSALKVESCLIDGEITVCDGKGLPVFDPLRHGSRVKPEAVLFAFDLLELDGKDLRSVPIEVRKRKLAHLVERADADFRLASTFTSSAFKCSNTPASWVARALSASASARATSPAAPTTGSRSRTRPRPP
jgi:bifunctional non-homologous end joining protein LigD